MTELTERIDQGVKEIIDKDGKYLTFSLADEEYGIGILKIKEVIGMMPVTSIPRTPEYSVSPRFKHKLTLRRLYC